jgi:Peptidase M66
VRNRNGVWLIPLFLASPVAAQPVFRDGFEQCDPALDADADRLDDCTELALGTSRVQRDTDTDGLPDGDEVLGTTDGLDLPAFGVSPLRRDVLLEADWLVGPECGAGFDRRLTAANVAQAQASLAAAPLVNPDGSSGIHLVVDYGQGGLFTDGNAIVGPDAFLAGKLKPPAPEFRNVQAIHFPANRGGRFHYLVLAWRYHEPTHTSSGIAEIGGDDLIVSLSCTPNSGATEHKYTNTLLHELGHNFGLRHGGDNECNERPNYNSLMNYRYQLDGTDNDCDALPENGLGTYSTGALPALDEQHLDETVGLCGLPIDWNGTNGIESDVTVDLNWEADRQFESCGGYYTTLHDFDDWSAIRFDFFGLPDGGAPAEEHAECAPL